MNRATEKELAQIAENINRLVPQKGWKYSIEYAYGRPRLVLLDNRGCNRDVSPRLSRGELRTWMWAFLEGVAACRN